MWNRVVAEFVATLGLIVVVTGGALGVQRFADLAGVLLVLAAAYGGATAALCGAAGGPAIVQLNPAVTLALMVQRTVGLLEGALHIVAQVLAAVLGAFLMRWLSFAQLWDDANGGTPTVAPDFGVARAFGLEALLAFLVTWVVLSALRRDAPEGAVRTILAPAAAGVFGLAVAAAVLVGAPLTGGSFNPVRWLGPATASGTWGDAWLYLSAPFLGAALAAGLDQAHWALRRSERSGARTRDSD